MYRRGGAGSGCCGAGVVVGAGVGEQGGDGAGGVFGEAGPDGDLVHVLVVEGLDVERGQEGLLDANGEPAGTGPLGGLSRTMRCWKWPGCSSMWPSNQSGSSVANPHEHRYTIIGLRPGWPCADARPAPRRWR